MNEVHTQPEGSRTSNGHDADGTAGQGRNGVPANGLIPDDPAAEIPDDPAAEIPDDPAAEIPELFQMPPAPTRRVLGRVHKAGPAPFVFVDDFAGE